MAEVMLTTDSRIADYFSAHKAELKGAKGDSGKTAYQTAVENGFEGTEADWLASLKGSDADATAAEAAIAAEVLRAKAAESALSTGLSTEESRAKGKEAELAARIAALKSFDVRVVDVLPNTGVANTVYLVPSTKSAVKNVKDEYLWINGAWEQIGSTAVDLSGYSTTSQMNSAIASAVGGVTVQSIGAAAASHAHTKDQITDFGGPYLSTSGGKVDYLRVNTDTDEEGDLTVGWGSGNESSIANFGGYNTDGIVNINGGFTRGQLRVKGDGGNVEILGGYYSGASISVGATEGETASIKKGGKEVATEDQLPYSSTSTPADRTCATVTVASTGASVTIPKPSTENKVTAFCVYLDMTALTGTAPTVGFKYPDNTDADILTRGGEGLSYETGAVNAVFFIQCGTKYIASAQVYK